MAGRIGYSLQQLIRERKITRIKPDSKVVLKEIEAAEYDLKMAQKTLTDNDAKWATVKAYYSMFHSARALLYSAGYREKSHRALLAALDVLFVKTGKLPTDLLLAFEDGMDLREEADYGMIFSEGSASDLITDAKAFLEKVRSILV
jgi:uncharacterized protein (UPF0332 family)